ncbi:fatty acyl-CoA reductase [Mycobacterium avium MAV_120709_2344]|nr:fatty acyl-CoA reductase [Mycobacterium avium MAV_120709_2344]
MSKSPLRRFADQLVLATMRPPMAPQVLVNRPLIKPVELAGKRVLLTGASSGIGEAAAEQFAREGARVVVVARRKDLLDALAERITWAGGEAIAMPCDISDLDAADALVADVQQRLGGVDILINNAGRSIRRPLAESLERWHDVERTMVLNYYAPLRLIRGIAPGMIERGDGHIINVSTWGVLSEASPLFAVYNASKAALSTVSRVVETEWGDKGVHSSTLYYPLVATPMIAPTKAYQGGAGADAGGGGPVDDHRRAHPAGAHRPADGDRRQGAGHLRPALGQRRHAAPDRPAQPRSRGLIRRV